MINITSLFKRINNCFFRVDKKDKQLLLFYSPLGYKGNARYLFELYQSDNLELVYLINDRQNAGTDDAKELKNILYLNELSHVKKLNLYSRCKFLILTHGYGKLPIYFVFLKVIQLWHGVPIKKILLDCRKDSRKYTSKIMNWVYLYFYRLQLASYNHLYMPEESILSHLESAFNKKSSAILIGENLVSYNMASKVSVTNHTEQIKVLYAPTWRDGKDTVIEFAVSLIKLFKNNYDVNFKIKLHPFEQELLNSRLSIEERKYIISGNVDINDVIVDVDIIISDFSSLLIDIKPFKINTILFAPDYDEYINSREIYSEYLKYFEENIIITEVELIQQLSIEMENISKILIPKESLYPEELIAFIEGEDHR